MFKFSGRTEAIFVGHFWLWMPFFGCGCHFLETHDCYLKLKLLRGWRTLELDGLVIETSILPII